MNSNSAKFDLNITNYTKPELEQLFDLPSNYDESVVEMQETKLRQNIMNDKSIVPSVKTQTLNFISEVKKTLIVNIMSSGPQSKNLLDLNWFPVVPHSLLINL